VSCAKTAELIDMPFVVWTRVGLWKHLLDGAHISATCWIPLNWSCVVVMQPFCQITLTTC